MFANISQKRQTFVPEDTNRNTFRNIEVKKKDDLCDPGYYDFHQILGNGHQVS